MILLTCPYRNNRATGGFRYNREIAVRVGDEELRYILVGEPRDRTPAEVELVILDSLFFLDPDTGLEVVGETDAPYGLLIHYLPSSDPTLGDDERHTLGRAENRLLSRAAGAVVTGSEVGDSILRRRPEVRIDLVPPGVSKVKETGLSAEGARRDAGSGPVRLVTVSNLSSLKGIDRLVPVLAGLMSMNWTWTIYGDTSIDNDYTRRVYNAIAEAGLGERIRIAGKIDPEGVGSALEDADVFVFPSLSESYGMAAAEATAAGLPVIMNGTGEMGRTLENGREGFVCPLKGDDLDEKRWERCLSLLIADGSLRRRMAAAAVCLASRFNSWDDTARDFMKAVRSWMK